MKVTFEVRRGDLSVALDLFQLQEVGTALRKLEGLEIVVLAALDSAGCATPAASK